jgi:hypothetical protein
VKIFATLCVVALLSGCTTINELAAPTDTQAALAVPKEDPNSLAVVKKRLLIANFLNRSRNGGPELAKLATERVKNSLTAVKDLTVIKQDELDLDDTFVNEVGEYDLKTIFQAAREHNMSGVLLGTIKDVSANQQADDVGLFRMRELKVVATVKLELYDTTTERQVFTKTDSADVTEEHTDYFNERNLASYDTERGKLAVAKAVDKSGADLYLYAGKLGWTGRIAKVDLRRFYINAGEMTGLSRGQLLKVYDEGQPVYDPESNNLLGTAPGRFKGLLKVVDYFGQDGAVAILYSGGGFKEKDRVEIFNNSQNP